MIDLQRALSALVGSVFAEEGCEEKAKMLARFAQDASEMALDAFGLRKDSSERLDNQFVYDFGHDLGIDWGDAFPADGFYSLGLCNVLPHLDNDSNHCGPMSLSYDLLFGDGRVHLFDLSEVRDSSSAHDNAMGTNRGKFTRMMSYEAAAVFVVCWLAEQLLSLVRNNPWGKVKDMPAIFNRLMTTLNDEIVA